LTEPDIEIFIEVRNDKAFIFTEKIKGPGGLPMGVS
jgi:thiamine biosynthesis protein ThiI